MLSETGDLRFCYLGTEPMIFMAPDRPIKDHKDTKRELVQLKKDLQNMSLQDGNHNFYISVSNSIFQNTIIIQI